MKMLSASPSDHLTFMLQTTAMYTADLRPAASGGRAISRAQMELIATRVSQLNKCAY